MKDKIIIGAIILGTMTFMSCAYTMVHVHKTFEPDSISAQTPQDKPLSPVENIQVLKPTE